MLWAESGGPKNPDWNSRPMQIGKYDTDAGWKVLLNGAKARENEIKNQEVYRAFHLMTDDLKKGVIDDKRNDRITNVQAGIAYLMIILCRAEQVQLKTGKDRLEVEVKSGDNATKIKNRVGTTIKQLSIDNPDVNLNILKVGQKLNYHKAHIEWKITKW